MTWTTPTLVEICIALRSPTLVEICLDIGEGDLPAQRQPNHDREVAVASLWLSGAAAPRPRWRRLRGVLVEVLDFQLDFCFALGVPDRRSSPPSTVEEYRGISYTIRDANNFAVAYVYFES
jgi:hypothetical protein